MTEHHALFISYINSCYFHYQEYYILTMASSPVGFFISMDRALCLVATKVMVWFLVNPENFQVVFLFLPLSRGIIFSRSIQIVLKKNAICDFFCLSGLYTAAQLTWFVVQQQGANKVITFSFFILCLLRVEVAIILFCCWAERIPAWYVNRHRSLSKHNAFLSFSFFLLLNDFMERC